ncbi:rhomboid family intramembrane serine protease [Microbacterium sp. X-17]|uniref:rhomboid family intramembrane serine protease n=1 Tax=Microbacterium sp. X-17 TaxID=3144404 RepID=UPI0031F4F683
MTTADFARNRDNFCYRHPDRVSFVLCQRCLRTICPECQTQAAVGVICPECMAEQRAASTPAQRTAERRWRRPRAAAVAAVPGGRPIVTYITLAVTSIVSLLQLLLPGSGISAALMFNSLYLLPIPGVPFEPWRILTMTLVHASFWHLALNMLALWMLGRILEPLVGHARFLVLYLLSAIGGSVAMALLAPGTSAVGASGAIFGLFGALIIIGRHIGAEITGIVIILGINLAIGFLPGMNVAWQAHVGGLVAGALAALVYARTRQRRQRTLQIVLLVIEAVILLGLLLIPVYLYT